MSPDLNEHVGVTFGGLRRVWRVGDLQQNRHFQARFGDSLPPRKKIISPPALDLALNTLQTAASGTMDHNTLIDEV